MKLNNYNKSISERNRYKIIILYLFLSLSLSLPIKLFTGASDTSSNNLYFSLTLFCSAVSLIVTPPINKGINKYLFDKDIKEYFDNLSRYYCNRKNTLYYDSNTKKIIDDIKTEFEMHTDNIPFKNGILITGPPGTGKTNIAIELAAKKGQFIVIPINYTSIFKNELMKADKWIQELFIYCQKFKNKKIIIVIDEIDMFCNQRRANNPLPITELERLNLVSGLIERINKDRNMMVVATSNADGDRDFDQCLRRPGRLYTLYKLGGVSEKDIKKNTRIFLKNIEKSIKEEYPQGEREKIIIEEVIAKSIKVIYESINENLLKKENRITQLIEFFNTSQEIVQYIIYNKYNEKDIQLLINFIYEFLNTHNKERSTLKNHYIEDRIKSIYNKNCINCTNESNNCIYCIDKSKKSFAKTASLVNENIFGDKKFFALRFIEEETFLRKNIKELILVEEDISSLEEAEEREKKAEEIIRKDNTIYHFSLTQLKSDLKGSLIKLIKKNTSYNITKEEEDSINEVSRILTDLFYQRNFVRELCYNVIEENEKTLIKIIKSKNNKLSQSLKKIVDKYDKKKS